MKNLPIKEEIRNLLVKNFTYPGVWEIRTKEKYLKLTSELECPGVKISKSDYEKPEDAVKSVETCAKVYKKLIQEGLYHPRTQVVICKDRGDNLTLLVLMPKLRAIASDRDFKKVRERVKDLEKRLGFDLDDDLSGCYFNWGYDEKTKEYYAHDLHVVKTSKPYKELLKIAEKMGVK